MRKCMLLALFALTTQPYLAGDLPDLAGTWMLNPAKSNWGKVRKPASVIVEIAHNQLSLSYRGWVTYADEDTREFAFIGAIDGNAYANNHSYGSGKTSYRRVSFDTLVSQFRTDDGKYTENVRIVLSANKRQMTRHIHVKAPEGDVYWTEVYERR